MSPKNKISRYFIFLSVITLISVLTFIVQRSYNNLMGPIEKAKSSPFMKPINPNLDLSLLDDIQQRQEFFESDLLASPSSSLP